MSSLLHFGVTDGAALLVKAVAPSHSSSTTNSSNIQSSGRSSNTGLRFINSIYEIPLDSRPEDLLTFCEVISYFWNLTRLNSFTSIHMIYTHEGKSKAIGPISKQWSRSGCLFGVKRIDQSSRIVDEAVRLHTIHTYTFIQHAKPRNLLLIYVCMHVNIDRWNDIRRSTRKRWS